MNEILNARNDLVLSRASWSLWGIPVVLGSSAIFVTAARPYLLLIAFTWAGVACIVNARRCGRFHCHITGPLYLALGLTSGLVGYGVLDLQWRWVALIFAAGTCIAYIPEFIGLRYVKNHRKETAA